MISANPINPHLTSPFGKGEGAIVHFLKNDLLMDYLIKMIRIAKVEIHECSVLNAFSLQVTENTLLSFSPRGGKLKRGRAMFEKLCKVGDEVMMPEKNSSAHDLNDLPHIR